MKPYLLTSIMFATNSLFYVCIAETIVEKCKFSAGRENNAKNFRGCGDLTYIRTLHCRGVDVL